MRVFILEDDPQRIMAFREAAIGLDLDLATDISEVPATFKPPYEWLFLDHDLGGQIYVSSEDENTGFGFVKSLPEADENFSPAVIVHSYNADGAKRMVALLHQKGYRAIYQPFGNVVLGHIKGLTAQVALQNKK